VPGTPGYVTDLVLAVIGVLAVVRLGPRGVRDRLTLLPLVPLGVYWVAGTVALARGLADHGFELTKQDAGLAVYSLILPIAALVASDAERLRTLFTVMVWAGVGGGTLALAAYIGQTGFDYDGIPAPSGGAAAGLYASAFPSWVFARLVLGCRSSRLQYAAATVSLLGVGATGSRSAWFALLASFAAIAVVATATRVRRPLTIALATAAGAALLAAGTVALEFSTKGDATNVQRELGGVIEAGSEGEAASNTDWRGDFWEYAVSRAARAPVAGAGYGEPLSFRWGSNLYDSRLPLATGGIDVTGPHNEYLHIAFRMGLFALAALIVLLAYGFIRGARVVRDEEVALADRAIALALVGLLGGAALTVGLNDALKGPYIGLYFWGPLALLLVAPWTLRNRSARPDSSSPASAA
jgi:O-antigen ligase